MSELNVTNVHAALVEIGADISNWQSDLYVRVTPEVTELLAGYEGGTVKRFRSNIDGSWQYEIPFAYTPWWDARLKK